MKSLTFSTGNMYKKIPSNDINKVISILKPIDIDIDGFMLCLLKKEEMLSLRMSDETLDYIRGMEYNSMHAPIMGYGNDKDTGDFLCRIEQIYKKIRAKHIVFHPYLIKDFSMLEDTKMNCLIEFLRPGKRLGMDIYKNILDENPNINFTHDICHSAQFSFGKIKEVFDIFSKRTKQVHISFASSKEESHLPMFMANAEFLKSAECVKQLDVEFCMEANMTGPEDIKKEVDFCRRWLED